MYPKSNYIAQLASTRLFTVDQIILGNWLVHGHVPHIRLYWVDGESKTDSQNKAICFVTSHWMISYLIRSKGDHCSFNDIKRFDDPTRASKIYNYDCHTKTKIESKMHHQNRWHEEDKIPQLGLIPVGRIKSKRPNNVSPYHSERAQQYWLIK